MKTVFFLLLFPIMAVGQDIKFPYQMVDIGGEMMRADGSVIIDSDNILIMKRTGYISYEIVEELTMPTNLRGWIATNNGERYRIGYGGDDSVKMLSVYDMSGRCEISYVFSRDIQKALKK